MSVFIAFGILGSVGLGTLASGGRRCVDVAVTLYPVSLLSLLRVMRHISLATAPAARELRGHAFEMGMHRLAGAFGIPVDDGFKDAAMINQCLLAQLFGMEVFFHLDPQAAALVP